MAHWIQEAPMALEPYSLWIAIVCAFLLFGFGWFLCARITAKKMREVEHQTEGRVSKLVDKADRERKAAFLEEKNRWYDTKRKFEREFEGRRREQNRLSEELRDKESGVSEHLEPVNHRDKELTRWERDVRQKESKLDRKQNDLDQVMVEQRGQLERISGMNVEHA